MEQGQRLYMVFSRGRKLRFLSHLDMLRLWERALRRARLPLRYSQGFHPHPRLSLALPLAVGMTAAAEWLECELRVPVPVEDVAARLSGQLPAGVAVCRVVEAPWKARSLAAQLHKSAYEVQVRRPPPLEQLCAHVHRFLQADSWPVQEQRQGRQRDVDLRTAVTAVEVGPWGTGREVVRFTLAHQGQGARMDTILGTWGLGPEVLLHRRWISFDPPIVDSHEALNP